VVALVNDLMDRSRLLAAVPGITFARQPADAAGATVVIVDLTRAGLDVAAVRAAAPDARLVAYGPHVDGGAQQAALEAGADAVYARSQFFRDPAATLGAGGDAQTSGQGTDR
jgi:hypothetical protein